jgi:hypothetical protein
MRIPLATPLLSRTNSTAKDAKIVNGYIETEGQKKYVIKRPGLAFSYTGYPSATAQGLYNFQTVNRVYAVLNNTLYDVSDSTTIGSVTSGIYSFTETTNVPYMFLHNSTNAYTYNNATGLFRSLSGGTGFVSGSVSISGNSIKTVSIGVAGTGYYTAPTVTIVDPTGTGAVVTATVDGISGIILGYVVISGGSGYTSPTVSIVAHGSGSSATATATTGGANTAITSVAITNGGTGYFSNNIQVLVNDTTGTGAVLTPNINSTTGAITSFNIVSGGIGYTAPTIQIYDAGALSFPTNQIAGTIIALTITNGGSGYSSTPTITITDPTGTGAYVNAVVTSGVVTGYIINNVGSSYTKPVVTITDPTGSGVGATATATISIAATPTLASGTVYLDNSVYVMTTTGRIYGSRVEDPTTWDALNYISKTSEPDGGVAIVKYSVYLLAFGAWSGEYFYDNGGAPPGSSLARNDIAKMEIGCAASNSVVQIRAAETVMWVGQSRTTGRGVYELKGTKPIKISNKAIESFINADPLTNTVAYTFTIEGHVFYVLVLKDTNYSFVYDLKEKEWTQWTDFNDNYFPPKFCVTTNNQVFTLSDGGIFNTIHTNYYLDGNGPINFNIVTDKFDGGNTKKKFWNNVQLIGDQCLATASVSHSGDDYQTWSNSRNIDLSQKMPISYNQGYDERRAYSITIVNNVPIRLEALEAEITEGIR